MARPIKSFRGLKVGDIVRLVEVPKFYRVGYNIHRDTMWVYRQILARKRPMRICMIDDWGLPYVHCRFRLKNGRWRDDWLGLDKEGWALVKRRRCPPNLP
jgi:hypothetical protein